MPMFRVTFLLAISLVCSNPVRAQEDSRFVVGANVGFASPFKVDRSWVRHDEGIIFGATAGYRVHKQIEVAGGASATWGHPSTRSGIVLDQGNVSRRTSFVGATYARVKLLPYPDHGFGYYLAGDGGVFLHHYSLQSDRFGGFFGGALGFSKRVSEKLDIFLEAGVRVSDPFGKQGSTYDTMHEALLTLGIQRRSWDFSSH